MVGAGRMARQHIAAIQRLPVPATIVGVHDRASAPADALAALAGCRRFDSLESLLRDARPDIVHVCTPPDAHFEATAHALAAGAHVYVEKPFTPTAAQARTLLEAARSQGRLVCAGHQMLRDPAFVTLLDRAPELGTIVQVDSRFAFRPPGVALHRSSPSTLARQLIDILPHPLYTLVSALASAAPGAAIDLAWRRARPGDLQAVLEAGPIVGHLLVSLRARPVAASITLTGTGGSLTCDFVRSMVVGAANPGTEVLEKIGNPLLEGVQLVGRTGAGLWRRLRSGTGYPGLTELIEAFYRAVIRGGASPVPPDDLRCVSEIFERLVESIDRPVAGTLPRPHRAGDAANQPPLVVVTGARGFLGAEICRALPRVRGIGRADCPDRPGVEQWVTADLSGGLAPEAVAGADVVVHAAAETAGGFDAHQRNSIDATRHLLAAMHEAGVKRLVLVSSLSVIRPPCGAGERLNERTPRAVDPRRLGPYTWGKCLQEELIEREAPALGIATRIIRPGALIDWREPTLPGLMGRRLFGRWHLGLGRPGLPIAVCDVERCAHVVAWCATHFEHTPEIVNVLDPLLATRAGLLARMREGGWNGRMVWMPISVLAVALLAARGASALARGRLPERLAPWSILRPRRYDAQLAIETFGIDASMARDDSGAEVALQT